MSTDIAVMTSRMKPLPRRHRIAHLRALIRQPSLRLCRRAQLMAVLRAELMSLALMQGRATLN